MKKITARAHRNAAITIHKFSLKGAKHRVSDGGGAVDLLIKIVTPCSMKGMVKSITSARAAETEKAPAAISTF